LACLSAIFCAQEAVTAEDTTAIVEEAVVVEETAQTGGMEAFARKLLEAA